MNDKELNQMEAWLSGQKRYKLFDTERLTVLRDLSPSEFKVWFFQWTQERDEQESWLSLGTLMKLTGLSKPTVRTARKRMETLGWIRDTGKTAAGKYSLPSRGSHKVKVYRVDDPTKAAGGKESLPVKNVNLPKSFPKVLAVAIDSYSGTTSVSRADDNCNSSRIDDIPSGVPDTENQKPQTTENQKPKTLASAAKWMEKYDAPIPEGFNVWSQDSRSAWTVEHKRKVSPPVEPPKDSALVKLKLNPTPKSPKVQPPSSAPPPIVPISWDDLELELGLEDVPYSIPDYVCGLCPDNAATFPGNGRGGKALDQHLHEVHGIRPR